MCLHDTTFRFQQLNDHFYYFYVLYNRIYYNILCTLRFRDVSFNIQVACILFLSIY